tara:strand:- start:539 stop:805 length:267 start_codon:yes stop_codon:yes gene_type:complete
MKIMFRCSDGTCSKEWTTSNGTVDVLFKKLNERGSKVIFYKAMLRVWSQTCKSCNSLGDSSLYTSEIKRLSKIFLAKKIKWTHYRRSM